ncbi:hypothetical protein JCM19301_2030 [Jejuia pallidilutea]|uniref:Uncharacterized protein n=1 Tax=Jejuia pallidilutea TaxID=504487 RepID=A0A090VWT7_9FLAO|nr:hypothetical protein JCM19301_2030 [Jejuia pallidilutea]
MNAFRDTYLYCIKMLNGRIKSGHCFWFGVGDHLFQSGINNIH